MDKVFKHIDKQELINVPLLMKFVMKPYNMEHAINQLERYKSELSLEINNEVDRLKRYCQVF